MASSPSKFKKETQEASNKRWIVCFTNSLGQNYNTRSQLEEVYDLMIQHRVNLILICYDMEIKE